jgi:2-oxoglutarate ferredoxin oxidoreductase subunit alpha
MTNLREGKVEKIANDIPDLQILGDEDADVCMIGWGGTYGHLVSTMKSLQEEGKKVALVHFNYIRPLPKNTEAILAKFKKRIVCELNLGQFVKYLRMSLPQFKYEQYNKVQGLPFTVAELKEAVLKVMEEK